MVVVETQMLLILSLFSSPATLNIGESDFPLRLVFLSEVRLIK